MLSPALDSASKPAGLTLRDITIDDDLICDSSETQLKQIEELSPFSLSPMLASLDSICHEAHFFIEPS